MELTTIALASYCRHTGRSRRKVAQLLKIMKLTALLLTAAMMQVSASGISQKLSFTLKDVPLEVAFQEIKRQTGCNFFYDYNNIKDARKVTTKVKNVSITEAMDEILKGQLLEYSIEEKTIVIRRKYLPPADNSESGTSAEITIPPGNVKGRVTDTTGNPIQGASVKLVPGNKGTTTDINGYFTIAGVEPGEYSLEISFVGYSSLRTKVSMTGSDDFFVNSLVLRLENKSLDIAVVMTGYTTIDKRLSASSVTSVKGSELERRDLFSVDNMLQGKVAGLNININSATPGAAPKVRLRGTSTLVGNREPVWVVDGVIVESPVRLETQQINSLDDVNLLSSSIIGVNPNDIDRIDILKDASATALYGVQGGNGVIVITTKRGRFNQSPTVSYSTSFRLGLKPQYKHFNLMNSQERVAISKEINERSLTYRFKPSRIGFEGAYLDYVDGLINFDQFNEQVKYFEALNTDWFGILFRNALDHSHNVSFNGGGQNSNYYASLGYGSQRGSAAFTQNERFTGLVKFNTQVNKNLVIGLKLSGAYNKGEYPYKIDPFSYAFNTSRAIPFQSPEGIRYRYANINNPGLADAIQANRSLFAEFNIMDELEGSRQNTIVRSWDVTADIDWKFLRHFRYRSVLGVATSQSTNTAYAVEGTSYVAQNYREYYALGIDIPDDRKANIEMPRGGEFTETSTARNTYTIRNSIEYSRTAGDHFVQGTLGTEFRHNGYDISKTFRLGYLPDRGMSFYNPDRNEYPKYYNDIALGRFSPLTLSNKINRLASVYAILIYSFKNRYTFNFNLRNDGSNRFGRKISEQFLPTFSGAFRWIISEEKFLQNSKKVDLLALRLSYGYNGNVPETESPRLILSQPTIGTISGIDQSTVVAYANPWLRWEQTRTFNAGIEFSLFDGKLSGDVDGYYKRGKDLIASMSVSSVNGINSYALNQASIENYGIEGMLKFEFIRKKNWGWSMVLVSGRNFSKILEAKYQKPAEVAGINGYLNGTIVMPGIDPNSMYSFMFQGINSNGLPTFKDLFYSSYNMKRPEMTEYFNNILVNSGSRLPQFDGSFSSSLRYKQWSFLSSFIVKLGYVKRLEKLYKANGMIPAPHENSSSLLVRRWRMPGDEMYTVIPRLTDERVTVTANEAAVNSGHTPYYIGAYLYDLYNNSDIMVVNASHVRFSSAAIQYSIRADKSRKKFFSSATIRLQGNDLFVLANKNFNGQDPETINGTLPRLPSFSLSADITF